MAHTDNENAPGDGPGRFSSERSETNFTDRGDRHPPNDDTSPEDLTDKTREDLAAAALKFLTIEIVAAIDQRSRIHHALLLLRADAARQDVIDALEGRDR